MIRNEEIILLTILTNISFLIFFVSAVSALAVGLLTVSFQSLKAARENPAKIIEVRMNP